MPRLAGVRERLHQPQYDTLIRTTGVPTTPIQNSTQLFGNANVGNLGLTNLQTAGALASDQTMVILALRCYLYFDGTNARNLYQQVSSQLFWTFVVGQKPMFTAPCWYFPAGGGVCGFDSTKAIYNLGEPTQESIMKLARPIVVPVRQNFAATATFFATGTTVALDLLNGGAADDQKIVSFQADGVLTRDVQ